MCLTNSHIVSNEYAIWLLLMIGIDLTYAASVETPLSISGSS